MARSSSHRSALAASAAPDRCRHDEPGGDHPPALRERDRRAFGVAQNIGPPAPEHAQDAVDQTVRHRTQRLAMVMALVHHQAPVDLGQLGIDPPVSGDVRKSSLDDTRKGPPDDVAGVKDGRHGDNFSFL